MGNTEILSKKDLEVQGQMERNKIRDMFEKVVETIFFLCAMVAVISVVALITFVFWKGLNPIGANLSKQSW